MQTTGLGLMIFMVNNQGSCKVYYQYQVFPYDVI
jgi:hypothetical protein